jgi:hypothetical protein
LAVTALGVPTIVVESVAVADDAPPPLTVAVLTCGEVASAATSTVTVIAP